MNAGGKAVPVVSAGGSEAVTHEEDYYNADNYPGGFGVVGAGGGRHSGGVATVSKLVSSRVT